MIRMEEGNIWVCADCSEKIERFCVGREEGVCGVIFVHYM